MNYFQVQRMIRCSKNVFRSFESKNILIYFVILSYLHLTYNSYSKNALLWNLIFYQIGFVMVHVINGGVDFGKFGDYLYTIGEQAIFVPYYRQHLSGSEAESHDEETTSEEGSDDEESDEESEHESDEGNDEGSNEESEEEVYEGAVEEEDSDRSTESTHSMITRSKDKKSQVSINEIAKEFLEMEKEQDDDFVKVNSKGGTFPWLFGFKPIKKD